MTRVGGLGRGLGALIPPARPGRTGLLELSPAAIVPNPRQPRRSYDELGLQELAASMRAVGVLQPLLVRAAGGGRYELIAGERRLRAARLARLPLVPVIVRDTPDDELLTQSLLENLHRADLNPIEEAAAYRQLLSDFGLTHDLLAARVGKSRAAISNALRLLALSPAVQSFVLEGILASGHARALVGLDEATQERLARRVVAEGLSVRETEELARASAPQRTDSSEEQRVELARQAERNVRGPYTGLAERLTDALATRVVISGSERKGRVMIDYSGAEDLERLLDVLSRGTGVSLGEEDPGT